MALPAVNGLSICSGVGGLELGLELACRVLGSRFVGRVYVEREAYAAACLVARMEDKTLEPAPVWDDVGTFDGKPWRDVVDIVSAGFPCQPWSTAGKRRGVGDERWLWDDIARVIREVEPEWVFLENVPPLVRGGIEHVQRDLALCGFDAEWDVFSAAQVGASHLRERLFILAHANRSRLRAESLGLPGRTDATVASTDQQPLAHANGNGFAQLRQVEELVGAGQEPQWHDVDGLGRAIANAGDTESTGRAAGRAEQPRRQRIAASECTSGATMADADESRRRAPQRELQGRQSDALGPFPPFPDDLDGWREVVDRAPGLEPAIRVLANGRAVGLEQSGYRYRHDQLRVLGNAVVPLAAALAFITLWRRLVG